MGILCLGVMILMDKIEGTDVMSLPLEFWCIFFFITFMMGYVLHYRQLTKQEEREEAEEEERRKQEELNNAAMEYFKSHTNKDRKDEN